MMSIRNKRTLLISEEFKTEYDIYIKDNKDILKIISFLDSVKLNKAYYKLNLFNNIDELKIKTINGYLNKITEINVDEIKQIIMNEIDIDPTLKNLTIHSLIEKCILQKNYSKYYIKILLDLDSKYDIKQSIDTIILSYGIMFNENITADIIDDIYKEQYLILCEKNKRLDNYIGYTEVIYSLEKNDLLRDTYDKLIIELIEKMKVSIREENKDDIYKYILCLYNIYMEAKSCPLEIKNELNDIKDKIKDKKILFKIMDILELF
jgi:hypothetical protein